MNKKVMKDLNAFQIYDNKWGPLLLGNYKSNRCDVLFSTQLFLIKHSFTGVLLLVYLHVSDVFRALLYSSNCPLHTLLCTQYDTNSRDRFQHILVKWLSQRGVYSKPLAIIFSVRPIFIAFPLSSSQKEERNIVKIFA